MEKEKKKDSFFTIFVSYGIPLGLHGRISRMARESVVYLVADADCPSPLVYNSWTWMIHSYICDSTPFFSTWWFKWCTIYHSWKMIKILQLGSTSQWYSLEDGFLKKDEEGHIRDSWIHQPSELLLHPWTGMRQPSEVESILIAKGDEGNNERIGRILYLKNMVMGELYKSREWWRAKWEPIEGLWAS